MCLGQRALTTGKEKQRKFLTLEQQDIAGMKPSEIVTSLSYLIATQQPLFLWGPPGVGKSQVVAQTAADLGLELVDIRALLLDPVDLRGLPRISPEGRSEWCIPSFLPTEGKGILFLDELNAAPPLVQASCYQLVLDRRLGEYALPSGWTIIAAGNRESDRAVTHRMPSALANRFVHIDFDPDLEEWLLWAHRENIAAEIVSFLRFRPALLHDFHPERSSKAFPSPRSWEFASNIVKNVREQAVMHQLLEGTVGAGAAKELSGYMKIWRQLPDPTQIFDAPQTIAIPEDPAILYAICEMVGRAASLENGDALILYARRLPTEFSILLVREAVRHCQGLALVESFGVWAAQHAEVMVS